jgi:hypothetical protein
MSSAHTPSWKLFLPLAVVLLLAGLWSVYWLIVLSYAKDRFAAERLKLSQQGLSMSCNFEQWGGYPFRFEFSCPSPVFKAEGKAEARSEVLQLVALAYAPWQVVALVDGPTTVVARQFLPTKAAHGRVIASVTLDKNWQPHVSAEIPRLEVMDLAHVDKLMVHTRPAEDGKTDISISAVKPVYTPRDEPPLSLDQFELLGKFVPAETLDIERIAVSQGNVSAWGAGTVMLDGEHRISGKLTAETNNLDALLNIAEPYLRLEAQQLANLRTVLGLLGNSPKLPVTAQDGQLYVGPMQVAKLLPLY